MKVLLLFSVFVIFCSTFTIEGKQKILEKLPQNCKSLYFSSYFSQSALNELSTINSNSGVTLNNLSYFKNKFMTKCASYLNTQELTQIDNINDLETLLETLLNKPSFGEQHTLNIEKEVQKASVFSFVNIIWVISILIIILTCFISIIYFYDKFAKFSRELELVNYVLVVVSFLFGTL